MPEITYRDPAGRKLIVDTDEQTDYVLIGDFYADHTQAAAIIQQLATWLSMQLTEIGRRNAAAGR